MSPGVLSCWIYVYVHLIRSTYRQWQLKIARVDWQTDINQRTVTLIFLVNIGETRTYAIDRKYVYFIRSYLRLDIPYIRFYKVKWYINNDFQELPSSLCVNESNIFWKSQYHDTIYRIYSGRGKARQHLPLFFFLLLLLQLVLSMLHCTNVHTYCVYASSSCSPIIVITGVTRGRWIGPPSLNRHNDKKKSINPPHASSSRRRLLILLYLSAFRTIPIAGCRLEL